MNTTLQLNEDAIEIFNELRQERTDKAFPLIANPAHYQEKAKDSVGCWFFSARGWTILPHVVATALNCGFDWGEELDRRYSDFLATDDKEEVYGASSYRDDIENFWQLLEEDTDMEPMWLFEEAEAYLNTHVAPEGYYFSHHPDWGDWGLYRINEPITEDDLNIDVIPHSGMIVISAMVNDCRESRKYLDMTREEAIAEFLAEFNEDETE